MMRFAHLMCEVAARKGVGFAPTDIVSDSVLGDNHAHYQMVFEILDPWL